ncbi:MAG: hypothetical protein FWG47_03675 [Propionibacteriaceae bacterium]|nr:hypothetical protein [Propionibacteriaceae bacterium]
MTATVVSGVAVGSGVCGDVETTGSTGVILGVEAAAVDGSASGASTNGDICGTAHPDITARPIKPTTSFHRRVCLIMYFLSVSWHERND